MEKERASTPLNTISESYCKEIPDDIELIDQVEIMYWNLWAQFGITQDNVALIDRLQLSIKDFKWTKRARNAFYKVEEHSRVISLLKKDDKLADWYDNCEPELV